MQGLRYGGAPKTVRGSGELVNNNGKCYKLPQEPLRLPGTCLP